MSTPGRGDELRRQLIEIVRERGLLRLPEPVVLASGELSRDFIDGKAALSRGEDLKLACEAILENVGGVEFDAVGGLTMGADQFAHVLAVLADKQWFVVRKEPKGRGTNKLVIQKAHDAITGLGAIVVAAATLVDRGDVAGNYFREREIPYSPVVTYRDLGIEPVGGGLVRT